MLALFALLLLPLQSAFPHPSTEEQRACVELLGAINADIVRRAAALMAAGDVALVRQGHWGREAQGGAVQPAPMASPRTRVDPPHINTLHTHPHTPHPTQLGALMREAQREFDARAAPLCPSQLASPVLHRVLAHPPIQPLIHGGKGVGSQVCVGGKWVGAAWRRGF